MRIAGADAFQDEAPAFLQGRCFEEGQEAAFARDAVEDGSELLDVRR
jgi:hypothetical protein